MRLYRITKSKYAEDLSGEGAMRYGGRWNTKGVPVIYTADSAALATLETIVNSPLKIVPKNRSITVFELSEDIKVESVEISSLPYNWRSYPAPKELGEIGTDWIKNKGVLALKVPSAILPEEEGWNVILNPRHPQFKDIYKIGTFPYIFDPRLFLDSR